MRKFFFALLMLTGLMSSHQSYADILAPFSLPIQASQVPITLSNNGHAYLLTEDVVGDITITGADVTLDLNDRRIAGRVIVLGPRAIVRNGKIIAPAPADNTIADAGVVEVASSANNAQLLDLFVSANDGTVTGVRGARGIHSDADDVLVYKSFVRGGNAGPVNGASAGGVGIQSTGNRLSIIQCDIFGGTGTDKSAAVAAAPTGDGGVGCVITSGTVEISSSIIIGGSSGAGSETSFSGILGPILLGKGGHAMTASQDSEVVIRDSELTGGPVSSIDAGILGTSIANLGALTNGNGGDGINSGALSLVLNNVIIRGGNVGPIVGSGMGVLGTFSLGSGGAGVRLTTDSKRTQMSNSTFIGGDAPTLTSVFIALAVVNNIVGGQGGAGIDVSQLSTAEIPAQLIITQSSITGGSAGDIVSGNPVAPTAAVVGNSAGHGIVLQDNVSNVSISKCIFMTLDGGDVTGAAGGQPRTGGNGGIAINLAGSAIDNANISENRVLATGRGGNVTAGAAGTGGNGGTGIFLSDAVNSAEISKNTVSSIGIFGTGNTSGIIGTGVDCQVGTSAVMIYGNFVYNTLAPYNLIGAVAYDAPTNGTNFFTALVGTEIQELLNIYKP